MTRTEYLKQLDKYLHRLPEEDYQEAMDYFTEYFDEAGPENEGHVMEELGTPKEAAQDILNALWDKKENLEDDKQVSRASLLRIALLSLILTPLSLIALVIIIPLVLGLLGMLFGILISAFVALIGGIAGALIFIWEALTLANLTPAALALSTGTGLVILGIGILLYLVLMTITRVTFRLLTAIIRRFTKKGQTA